MQLDFLHDNVQSPVTKESRSVVSSKTKKKLTASPDLFSALHLALPPEKSAKEQSQVLTEAVNEGDALPKKAEGAFRTISEASAILDVPQHVLRFWESRFSQVKPLKLGGGRRYYRPEDIDILSRIKNLLYKQGYTIKGAKKAFSIKDIKAIKTIDIPEIIVSPLVLTEKQKKQVSLIRHELIKLRSALQPYISDLISA